MSKRQVIHLHRYIARRTHTINTTRCGRVNTRLRDYNVTADESEVTCKFCLATLAAIKRRQASQLVRVQINREFSHGETL